MVRLYITEDYYDGSKYGANVPIYMIGDPNGTGVWSEADACYNVKRTGVAWTSSGNLSTALGPIAGHMYFKNWYSGGQSFYEADLTTAVQTWVAHPNQNLGFYMPTGANFNKRIAAHEYSDPARRPILEVTYEAANTESIPAPTALAAHAYSGQTFLTWTEASTGRDETSYRIYRHTQPITSANLDQAELLDQVWQGSSYLSDTIAVKQPDLSAAGVTLQASSGLFVYTAKAAGNAYYAVTTVVEGNENRQLTAGVNSLGAAVAESTGLPSPFYFNTHTYPNYYDGYVVFLGSTNPTDPTDAYGFDNRPCAPVLFLGHPASLRRRD